MKNVFFSVKKISYNDFYLNYYFKSSNPLQNNKGSVYFSYKFCEMKKIVVSYNGTDIQPQTSR